MPVMINPAGIPGANLRPDMVEIAATEMSSIGDQVSSQAATVVSVWQRLAAHYEAPEAGTLFGVMDPVKANGETFDTNIGRAAGALKAYAVVAEQIKAELAAIKEEALAFVGSVSGGVEKTTYSRAGAHTSKVEWHEDQDSVDANNALWTRVSDAMERLWAAERACANAIYDIIGFPHIEAASDANPNGYGLTDIPAGTETPWGSTVERTESCGEKFVTDTLWEGVVVNGIWGTVQGVGSLTLGYNPQTGEWFDGDTYGAAWSNLGMLAVGLAIPLPMHAAVPFLPGPVGDFLRRGQDTLVAAGKGLVAWDKWADDPWTAAGEATFNVASILVPVGAATAPVRTSASTAAAAIRGTARTLNYLDPAGLLLDGAGTAARAAAPAVIDITRHLDLGRTADLVLSAERFTIDIPNLPATGRTVDVDVPTVARTDMTVTTPRGEGDLEVPVRVPQDVVPVPPVRQPELATVGGGAGGGTATIGGGGGSVEVPTGGSAGSGGTVPTGGGAIPTGGGAIPTSGGTVPTGGGAIPTGGGGLLPGSGGGNLPPAGAGGGGGDVPPGNAGGGGGTGNDGGPPNGGSGGTPAGGTPDYPTGSSLPTSDWEPGLVRDASNRGDEVNPAYGQETGNVKPEATNPVQLDPRYAPPPLEQVHPDVRSLVTDPAAPYGRGADGQPYSQKEWEARYLDERSRPIYPGNDGAVEGRRYDFSSASEFTARYGGTLDRMGGTGGGFMSFPGTPFEARALPGSNLSSPYLTMRLTGELPPHLRIEVSEIAPAFGQPGGGLQVRVIDITDPGNVKALSVDELQQQGVLDVVDNTKPDVTSDLLVPETPRIEPGRVDNPYPDMVTETHPSGLTVVRTPGLEVVRLELPDTPGATMNVTPNGTIVVEQQVRPVREEMPYPDSSIHRTPSGLEYVEQPLPEGFERAERPTPPPMTEDQSWTAAVVVGLYEAAQGLSVEAIKDGVNQLNEARAAQRPVDPLDLPAEIRQALRQAPELFGHLIEEGAISEQAAYRWPDRPRRWGGVQAE